jgi:ribosome-associated protein
MIEITSSIVIDDSEIQEEFIRSSGPGGQNVNKVATTVQLRFDVANSPSLPEEVRERLISLARSRITEDGVLIINARRFRTQGRNRQDAIERLAELIRRAAEKPRSRRKTRPTLASKMRRLEEKHRRAETKKLRQGLQSANE